MTTGTQIHYYHLCKRKLWLFSNGIQMEQDSALVAEGKFIHETTYTKRADKYKELDFGYVKIDHYDGQNKVIHEVKKSNKLEFVMFSVVRGIGSPVIMRTLPPPPPPSRLFLGGGWGMPKGI